MVGTVPTRRIDNFDEISDDEEQVPTPQKSPEAPSFYSFHVPENSGNPAETESKNPAEKNPQLLGRPPIDSSDSDSDQENIRMSAEQNLKRREQRVLRKFEKEHMIEAEKKEKIQEEPIREQQVPSPLYAKSQCSETTIVTQPEALSWPHNNPNLSSFGQLRLEKIKAYHERLAAEAERKLKEEEAKLKEIQADMESVDSKSKLFRPRSARSKSYKRAEKPANRPITPCSTHQSPQRPLSHRLKRDMSVPAQRPLANAPTYPILPLLPEPKDQRKAQLEQLKAELDKIQQDNQKKEKLKEQQKEEAKTQLPVEPSLPDIVEIPQKEQQIQNQNQISIEKETDYPCSGCRTVVPHNQLFVCTKPGCLYSVQQPIPIPIPNHFFRIAKVFCGSCAFRGCHSAHEKHMTEALSYALQFASLATGGMLETSFVKLAELKLEDPVDYMIFEDHPEGSLKTVPVQKYLTSAPNTIVWHERVEKLENVLETVTKARFDAQGFVNGLAGKALNYYTKLNQAVLHDLHTRKPAEAQAKKLELEEHAISMGLPADYYTRQQQQEYETPSANAASILSSQADLMDQIDADVIGAGDGWKPDGVVLGKVEQRVDEGAVKMLYIMMCRRFDLIKDEMKTDGALKELQKLLLTKNVTAEMKQAAAEMFREKCGLDLVWPPNYESEADGNKENEP